MISLEAIVVGNWDIASQAAKQCRRPLLMRLNEWKIDVARCHNNLKPWTLEFLPDLGHPSRLAGIYPGEWKLVRTYLVDVSGRGIWRDGEPALSVSELCEHGFDLTQRKGEHGWFCRNEGRFLYVYAAKYFGGNGSRC
jgi:hypothetical protein